ncbi:hypothetical protein BT69DRAFT_1356234 [Atractiella rhizophila]|nr:hypothetical protein BT69DRAFT_1356234 [Atractiella rhizophila]
MSGDLTLDNLHETDFAFSLDNLESLNSGLLSLVQYHPQATPSQIEKAELIFHRRWKKSRLSGGGKPAAGSVSGASAAIPNLNSSAGSGVGSGSGIGNGNVNGGQDVKVKKECSDVLPTPSTTTGGDGGVPPVDSLPSTSRAHHPVPSPPPELIAPPAPAPAPTLAPAAPPQPPPPAQTSEPAGARSSIAPPPRRRSTSRSRSPVAILAEGDIAPSLRDLTGAHRRGAVREAGAGVGVGVRFGVLKLRFI